MPRRRKILQTNLQRIQVTSQKNVHKCSRCDQLIVSDWFFNAKISISILCTCIGILQILLFKMLDALLHILDRFIILKVIEDHRIFTRTKCFWEYLKRIAHEELLNVVLKSIMQAWNWTIYGCISDKCHHSCRNEYVLGCC